MFGDRWAGFTESHRQLCAAALRAPYFLHPPPTEEAKEAEEERHAKQFKTEFSAEEKKEAEATQADPLCTPPESKGNEIQANASMEEPTAAEETLQPIAGSATHETSPLTCTPAPPDHCPSGPDAPLPLQRTTSTAPPLPPSPPLPPPRSPRLPAVLLPSAVDPSPTATVIATASHEACCHTVLLWRDTTLWEITFHTLYRIRRTLDAAFHQARWAGRHRERPATGERAHSHHARKAPDEGGDGADAPDARQRRWSGRHPLPPPPHTEEEGGNRECQDGHHPFVREDGGGHTPPSSPVPLSSAVEAHGAGKSPVQEFPTPSVGDTPQNEEEEGTGPAVLPALEAPQVEAKDAMTSFTSSAEEMKEVETDEAAREREAYEKAHVARYQLHWWAGALCSMTARPRFHFLGSVVCESVLADHPMVIPVRTSVSGGAYGSDAGRRNETAPRGRANRQGKRFHDVGIAKALNTPVVDNFTYPGLGAPLFVYPERLQ